MKTKYISNYDEIDSSQLKKAFNNDNLYKIIILENIDYAFARDYGYYLIADFIFDNEEKRICGFTGNVNLIEIWESGKENFIKNDSYKSWSDVVESIFSILNLKL